MTTIETRPFTPGGELGARQLEAVLAMLRAASADSVAACHGVDALDTQRALIGRTDGQDGRIELVRVRGLTPDRTPIRVDPGSGLTAPIALDGAGGAQFDASVRVNRPGLDGQRDSERILDLVLRAPGGEPALREHELYLGRYTCRRAGSDVLDVALQGWPAVRRLAAIEPYDVSWRARTQPIEAKLRAWSARALDKPLDRSGRAIAFAAQVGRLRASWSVIDLDELQRELLVAARLSRAERQLRADAGELLHPAPIEPFAAHAATFDGQVAALGAAVERVEAQDGGLRRLACGAEVDWHWVSEDRIACKLGSTDAAHGLILRFPQQDGLSRRLGLSFGQPRVALCLDARVHDGWIDFDVPAARLRGSEVLTLSGLRQGRHDQPELEVWVSEHHDDRSDRAV